MYRTIIALCVHLMPTEQTPAPALIALRDIHFFGEDQQIASRLKQMTALTNSLDVDKALSETIPVKRFGKRARSRSAPSNVSRPRPARRYEPYSNDPDDFNIKVVAMMKQVIYLTQQRLQDMEPVVKKYEKDERMRLAFVMCTLDEWVELMHAMYTMLLTAPDTTVSQELLYYQHFTKKSIDITYTVENLMELYAVMITKLGYDQDVE